MNNLSKQEQTEARFQYAERENCRMKSNATIVVYGSSTGTCEAIAEKIAQKLGCEACHRLCRQSIDYVVQPAGKENVNVYFGRRECLDAIRLFVTRPLNELTPEEDFILGAMLGYDICAQCERYCERKGRCANCKHAQ